LTFGTWQQSCGIAKTTINLCGIVQTTRMDKQIINLWNLVANGVATANKIHNQPMWHCTSYDNE